MTAESTSQRPASFRMKVYADPTDEGEEHNAEHLSAKSWKLQLLRLVNEAPQPGAVFCTEPRIFPHRGNNNRISESSWSSDATCCTDVTHASSNSLTALVARREGVDGENQTMVFEEALLSPLKQSGFGKSWKIPANATFHSEQMGENKIESFEHSSDDNRTLKKCKDEVRESGETQKEVSSSSAASTAAPTPQPPQEDSNTTTNHLDHTNSPQEHQQQAEGKSRHTSSLSIQGDSDYWEKFRYSKDYQSSLMIETICNEVFNLTPGPRYKSLMKLSQKSRRDGKKNKGRRQGSLAAGEVAGATECNNDKKEEGIKVAIPETEGKDKDNFAGGTKEETKSIPTLKPHHSNKREEEMHSHPEKTVEETKQKGNVSRLRKRQSAEEKQYFSRHMPMERKKSCISTTTSSSVFTTLTTEESDENCEVAERIRRERMLMMAGFGQAFHGYLTKRETANLLTSEGQYLVRQVWSEDAFILSFLFDGEIRNYRVMCDVTTITTTARPTSPRSSSGSSSGTNNSSGNNVLYTYYLENRSKCYYTLDELVREGLITLQLDENAGSYIDLLVELAQFQQTDNLLQTPPAVTPGARRASRSASLRTIRLTSISSAIVEGVDDPTEDDGFSQMNAMKKSVDIALLIHFFEEEIFDGLTKCNICFHGLWGPSNKGLRCRDCGLPVHESCVDNVKLEECKPDLSTISPFSTDLTTLVKGSFSAEIGTFGLPYVLQKCIDEIEARGVDTEGIYRVSGLHQDFENLKQLFEKDRININLSACQDLDIHSITGLVKFFLRQLPDSLITQEAMEEFTQAGELMMQERVQMLISSLPPAHRITLKYFLEHVSSVSKEKVSNKMTAFNLSSVLMPSVMGPTNMSFDALESNTKLLYFMITQVNELHF